MEAGFLLFSSLGLKSSPLNPLPLSFVRRIALTLAFLGAFALASMAQMNYSELFSVDDAELINDFEVLNELEADLITHGVDREAADHFTANFLSDSDFFSVVTGDPIVPSFVWGCLCSCLGVGLVYIVTEGDPMEVRSSILGCSASFLISILYYMALSTQ